MGLSFGINVALNEVIYTQEPIDFDLYLSKEPISRFFKEIVLPEALSLYSQLAVIGRGQGKSNLYKMGSIFHHRLSLQSPFFFHIVLWEPNIQKCLCIMPIQRSHPNVQLGEASILLTGKTDNGWSVTHITLAEQAALNSIGINKHNWFMLQTVTAVSGLCWLSLLHILLIYLLW